MVANIGVEVLPMAGQLRKWSNFRLVIPSKLSTVSALSTCSYTRANGTAAGVTLICTAYCDDSRAKPIRADRLAPPVGIAHELSTKQEKRT